MMNNTKGENMAFKIDPTFERYWPREAVLVLKGLFIILVFALGIYLGAKVERGLTRPEAVAAAEVVR